MPPLRLTLGIAVLPAVRLPAAGQEEAGGLSGLAPHMWVLMACWDSKRERILDAADGGLLALAPKTGMWINLKPWAFPGGPAGIPPRRRDVSIA